MDQLILTTRHNIYGARQISRTVFAILFACTLSFVSCLQDSDKPSRREAKTSPAQGPRVGAFVEGPGVRFSLEGSNPVLTLGDTIHITLTVANLWDSSLFIPDPTKYRLVPESSSRELQKGIIRFGHEDWSNDHGYDRNRFLREVPPDSVFVYPQEILVTQEMVQAARSNQLEPLYGGEPPSSYALLFMEEISFTFGTAGASWFRTNIGKERGHPIEWQLPRAVVGPIFLGIASD
jgi:hypothetical protein